VIVFVGIRCILIGVSSYLRSLRLDLACENVSDNGIREYGEGERNVPARARDP
jgi:hypothetical protein